MVIALYKKGKYTYVLSKSEILSEDFGIATVYGISILNKKEKTAIKDISDDFGFVKQLFDLIVEEELYPEHLNDVVEDYLFENFPKNTVFVTENIPQCIA